LIKEIGDEGLQKPEANRCPGAAFDQIRCCMAWLEAQLAHQAPSLDRPVEAAPVPSPSRAQVEMLGRLRANCTAALFEPRSTPRAPEQARRLLAAFDQAPTTRQDLAGVFTSVSRRSAKALAIASPR